MWPVMLSTGSNLQSHTDVPLDVKELILSVQLFPQYQLNLTQTNYETVPWKEQKKTAFYFHSIPFVIDHH